MSNPWAKLTSINRKSVSTDFELRENIINIGRADTNEVKIDNPKISKIHCIVSLEGSDIFIQDKSSNGTFIQDTQIGKDNKIKLNPGDIIYLLHKNKTQGKCEDVGFVFSIVNLQEQSESVEKFNQEILKIKEKLSKERELKMNDIKQEAEKYKCSICQELIHDYVQLSCCIHGFCGGCLSEYLMTNQTCPDCRQKITYSFKNPNTNSTIEKLIKGNAELKRNPEEYEELELKNVITSSQTNVNELIKLFKKKSSTQAYQEKLADIQEKLRKRIMGELDSDYSYMSEDEEEDLKINPEECPECKIQRLDDSFKCQKSQRHIQCSGCKRKFPDRPEKQNQRCVLCKHPFCGLYLGVCKNNMIANKKQDKYLSKFQDFKAPQNLAQNIFRNNKTEIQIFNEFLKKNNFTNQSILDYMNQNFVSQNKFSFEKSKKILQHYNDDPTSTQINLESAVCSDCFPIIWYQIVLRYRMHIKDKLPNKYANRPPCHWGINCTTQITKQSHSENYDHICEQVRFA